MKKTYRAFVLFVFIALPIIELQAAPWWSSEFEVNGIWYSFDTNANTASVINPKSGDGYKGTLVIPENIIYHGKHFTVTGITSINGDELERVVVPATVDNIHHIFGSKLKSIDVDTNNEKYKSKDGVLFDKSMKTLILYPEGLKQEYIVPNGVETIQQGAFYMTTVTGVSLPNTLKTIENSVFHSCLNLMSLEIPNSVNKIGEHAFAWCKNLQSVQLSNNIKTIEYHLFDGCKSLKSITIPQSVEYINNGAFFNCQSLEEITIPALAYIFDGSSFMGCSSLKNIYVDEDNVRYLSIDGVLYERITPYSDVVGNLTLVAFPGGREGAYEIIGPSKGDETKVTAIEGAAFAYNKKLNKLVIPSTVTSIGDGAFYDADIKDVIFYGTSLNFASDHYNFDGISYSTMNYYTSVFYGLSSSSVVYMYDEAIEKYHYYFEDVFWDDNVGRHNYNEYTKREDKCTFVAINHPYDITDIQKYNRGFSFKVVENPYYEWPCELEGISLLEEVGTITIQGDGSYLVKGLLPNVNYHVMVKYKKSEDYSSSENYSSRQNQRSVRTSAGRLIANYTADYYGITINDIEGGEDITTPPIKTKGFLHGDYGDTVSDNDPAIISGLNPGDKYTVFMYVIYDDDVRLGAIRSGTSSISNYKEVYKQILHSKGKPTTYIYNAPIMPTSIFCQAERRFTTPVANAYFEGYEEEGDVLMLTGLTPENQYTFKYIVEMEDGYTFDYPRNIQTCSLELTTLNPMVVNPGEIIVNAETNISDEESNVFFEWRKVDAPDIVPSKNGQACVFYGTMQGRIHNLDTSTYWQVRPYYESSEGNRYYGEWIGVDPSDYSYFEPIVHTYDDVDVTSESAKVTGYVVEGSDIISEQGFEYWQEEGQTFGASSGNVHTVTASGQRMTASFVGLREDAIYLFRAYVKTSKGYTYGETQSFKTLSTQPTGIKGVCQDMEKHIVGYYDALGRKHEGLHHGLNIIRYSDGTVRKVRVK